MQLTTGRLRLALVAEVVVLVLVSIGIYHVFGHRAVQATTVTVTVTTSGAVTDHFTRPGPSLGAAPGGTPWQVVGGSLVISHHVLTAGAPPPGGSAALLPVPSVDTTVRANVVAITSGWSLVVRWQDPRTYWRLEAVPSDAGYRLVHVVDGFSTTVGHTGLAALTRGTNVAISARGSKITVAIDGIARLTATDPDPAGHLAGIMAAPGARTGASWDDVTVGAPANVVWPTPDNSGSP